MSFKTSLFSAGLFTVFFAVGLSAGATEYFVSRQGNDGNDGSSKAKAYLTIQKGVDALKTGDTLTIAPGEYSEHVRRDNLGDAGQDTVIRAEIPGTVLLRGDVAAPEFKPVEGYRYVYSAPFDREVQAVNEVDTLTFLETATNVVELEFTPGACFYDAAQKQLYISTSDMQPPGRHHYTVSVIKNFGLFLHNPERVVVEGISVTGFNNNALLVGSPGYYSVWGMMLVGSKRCVIRQCTAFLNAGGIAQSSGIFGTYDAASNQVPVYRKGTATNSTRDSGSNRIEQCRAYANSSRYNGEGGNITIFDACNDVIRDCETHSSAMHGIRHYGGIHGPAILSNNLSWGNLINDLCVKGGDAPKFGLAERCVSLGPLHVVNVKHCIIGKENRYNSNPGADNFRYDLEAIATRDREFADPDNLDFRLQADSKFRGAAPDGSDRGPFPYETNIFYVKPSGDDQADGLSMGQAWKTLGKALKCLRPGDTLYLAGGAYEANAELKAGGPGDKPVAIRGRGTVPVVIRGTLALTQSRGVTFERLSFADRVIIQDSQTIVFNNCAFTGTNTALQAKNVEGLTITHGFFAGPAWPALEMTACAKVYLSGNIYNNQGPALRLDRTEALRYSDYNSYRDTDPAWEANGSMVALTKLRPQHECYSRVLKPEVGMDNGAPFLKNRSLFSAGGPNGTALGIHREFKEKALRVSDPVLHSVTPTTANLEWWTSLPARCDLAWGETPECTNHLPFKADGFGGFSLAGLKPGTPYYFRIAAATPFSTLGAPEHPDTKLATAPMAFETARALPEPVVYHVAPDGNDRNSGLSRDQALRTVTRAAQQANAGDTVLIAGGVYKETVRIHATGLPGRPITFKSLPGEKVIFDGDNKTLATAFIASGKHHLRFDGLYFRQFLIRTGIFDLYQSNGIEITRCFSDGRGPGYSASFVFAEKCAGLGIRNCFVTSSFYSGIYLVSCPDATIANNVLCRNLILECVVVNEPDQKVRLVKNIITDNVPHKVMVALLEVACMASLVEENNCYYFRIPPEKRKMFTFYDPVAYERTVAAYGLKPVDTSLLFTNLVQLTLAEFQQKSGQTNSFAANPGFKATAEMKAVDKDGKPVFLVDQLLGKKDLDFPDLFATDPEVVRRGIGLVPGDFEGFRFDVKP